MQTSKEANKQRSKYTVVVTIVRCCLVVSHVIILFKRQWTMCVTVQRERNVCLCSAVTQLGTIIKVLRYPTNSVFV